MNTRTLAFGIGLFVGLMLVMWFLTGCGTLECRVNADCPPGYFCNGEQCDLPNITDSGEPDAVTGWHFDDEPLFSSNDIEPFGTSRADADSDSGGTDAGSDAGTDSGSDAGTDAAPVILYPGCPCLTYSSRYPTSTVDNFCMYVTTTGCPMTFPGGYCDPDADGETSDADWTRGFDEYQMQCS